MTTTSPAILLALGIAATMIATTIFIVFYHDRKHSELDQWIAFSFSGDTLRHALSYYRFMAVSMIVFYVLFTISCLLLQASEHQSHSPQARSARRCSRSTSCCAGGFSTSCSTST